MSTTLNLQLALNLIAQANEINVPLSLAVVDAGGHLVALHRMDGTDLD